MTDGLKVTRGNPTHTKHPTYLDVHVHCSTIYSSQDGGGGEPKFPSMDEWRKCGVYKGHGV